MVLQKRLDPKKLDLIVLGADDAIKVRSVGLWLVAGVGRCLRYRRGEAASWFEGSMPSG